LNGLNDLESDSTKNYLSTYIKVCAFNLYLFFYLLGQESGFQSCTSLVSLGVIQHNQNHQNREYQNREYQNQIQPLLSHATAAAQPLVLPQQAKHSLFRGSPLALPKFQYAESR
jgi:hypothetical protein